MIKAHATLNTESPELDYPKLMYNKGLVVVFTSRNEGTVLVDDRTHARERYYPGYHSNNWLSADCSKSWQVYNGRIIMENDNG